jgi:ribonucrease Y
VGASGIFRPEDSGPSHAYSNIMTIVRRHDEWIYVRSSALRPRGRLRAGVLGQGCSWTVKKPMRGSEAERIIQEGRNRADALLKEASLEAKDRLLVMKNEFDAETKETRAELKKQERRLIQKEENIDRKIEVYERKEKEVNPQGKRDRKASGARSLSRNTSTALWWPSRRKQLEKISGLTSEQAKELLLRAMENEARYEGAKLIKRIESEAKEEADKKAKKILATAIQRYAADYVAERTVTVVPLPSDEMKGRIIGREGRNIRALEAATGIDLIIDDTPEAVILSGFNPVRREVARQSLMKLIADGRIHPARIEDVVKKVTLEIEPPSKRPVNKQPSIWGCTESTMN